MKAKNILEDLVIEFNNLIRYSQVGGVEASGSIHESDFYIDLNTSYINYRQLDKYVYQFVLKYQANITFNTFKPNTLSIRIWNGVFGQNIEY
jgi:hypothetical protein